MLYRRGGWFLDMGREKSADFGGFKVVSADEALDAELDRSVPSSVPLAYAVMLAGDQPGRVYVLHRNTSLIGRLDTADIALSDASVSARHARIISGSRGFEIEDLESTNGTVIGGQRITRAPLRNGDRVTIGNVDFIFLLERPMSATIQVQGMRGVPSPLPTGATLIRPSQPGLPALIPPPQAPPWAPATPVPVARDRDGDEGASLTDIVGFIVRGVRYLQQRRWTIVAIICVCAALGVASMLIVPPRTQAVVDLKLLPQAKDNPVDWRPPDEQALQTFFQTPERTFTQTELISATLSKLEGTPPTDARADKIATRLKLDSMGDHLFRASFTDPYIGRGKPRVDAFLTSHTQAYVQKEIDRALREFNAKVTFLRDQVKAVDADLARISDERTKFRAQNADRLPEDAMQTHSARFQLDSRRADLTAQVRLLEGQLDAARVQLKAGRPLVEAKFTSSQSYRTSLGETNRKLSEAYASAASPTGTRRSCSSRPRRSASRRSSRMSCRRAAAPSRRTPTRPTRPRRARSKASRPSSPPRAATSATPRRTSRRSATSSAISRASRRAWSSSPPSKRRSRSCAGSSSTSSSRRSSSSTSKRSPSSRATRSDGCASSGRRTAARC